MWTEKEIVIERICIDEKFFEDIMPMIEKFFVYSVLLELIGKWYTRKPIADSSGVVPEPTSTASTSVDKDEVEKSWCYCHQPSFGTMIGCDSSDCTIQWFHCDCLSVAHLKVNGIALHAVKKQSQENQRNKQY